MLSTQQKLSIGYFLLTLLGLLLIHAVFSAPQSENLSYRDFEDVSEVLVCYSLGLYEPQSNLQANRVIA